MNQDSYLRRLREARRRLYLLLLPQSNTEREVVDWLLRTCDLVSVESLTAMVERERQAQDGESNA